MIYLRITLSKLLLAVIIMLFDVNMATLVPTTEPTNAPTPTPTASPSHCPSIVPSALPTLVPTFTPTMIPTTTQPTTSYPTSRPSRQPSAQPSHQPISQPSAQPLTRPSGQPSFQPITQPTSQPSGQPFMRPSNQPSSQPNTQPTVTPSLQPTLQPSRQPISPPTGHPSCQPSYSPSMQPSSKPTTPTGQPTNSPSMQPSLIPSGQPLSRPSSLPSVQPSTMPSMQPTAQPTSCPSGIPSAFPSNKPAALPSSIPTGQPSLAPSIRPTVQPTAIPSGQPLSQPSYVPSSQPVMTPTMQPSLQPTSIPTAIPTQPTSRPTGQPNAHPTGQPSARPSAVPECNAGQYYEFTGDSQYVCLDCPAGTFSAANQRVCTPCSIGYFSQSIGSVSCEICPVSTYASKTGLALCTSCPNGMVTGGTLGATSVDQCLNPLTNFIFGSICLFFCLVAFSHYIGGGRLQRIAFIRKEMLVKQGQIMFHILCDKIDYISHACNDQNKREQRGRNQNTIFNRVIKPIVFWLLACLLIIIITSLTLASSLLKVFFTALILWRGYSLNFSFVRRIERYLNVLKFSLSLPEYTLYVFYPFIFVARNVASLNINLAAVNVSCPGAQAPIKLLLTCVVTGIVVIIIESDMEVFWQTQLMQALQKFRSLLFNRYFFKTNNKWHSIVFFLWSCALSVLPSPRKLLQYALGLVTLSFFFADDGHALSSADCDKTSVIPLDTILAYSATVMLYLLVFPIMYMMSQILVPSFQLSDDDNVDNRQSLAPADFRYDFGGDVEMMTVVKEPQSPAPTLSINNPLKATENPVSSKRGTSDKTVSTSTKEVFAKKQVVKKRHRLASALKMLALLSSFDWFYIKVMFRFAESLYVRLMQFNLPDTSKKHYSGHNKADKNADILPKVPWFHALTAIFATDEDTSSEWGNLKTQWYERSNEIPSYFRMVKTVQEDIMTTETFMRFDGFTEIEIDCMTYITSRFMWIVSWTIIAQLYSKRGRNIWYRVVRNYMVLVQATFGHWSDSVVHSFGLNRKMDEFDEIEHLAEQRIHTFTTNSNQGSNSSPNRNSSNNRNSSPRNGFYGVESIGEQKSQRLSTFAALISARVVLLQLVPFLTVASTLAVDISSSPIFITCDDLADKLPGLLVWGAYSEAKERLQQDNKIKNPPQWQIVFMSCSIFFTESRLIQCFVNVSANSFAFVIIFFGDDNKNVQTAIVVFVILFTIVGLVVAMDAILLLNRLMFPVMDDEDGDDTQQNGDSNSKDIENSPDNRENQNSHQHNGVYGGAERRQTVSPLKSTVNSEKSVAVDERTMHLQNKNSRKKSLLNAVPSRSMSIMVVQQSDATATHSLHTAESEVVDVKETVNPMKVRQKVHATAATAHDSLSESTLPTPVKSPARKKVIKKEASTDSSPSPSVRSLVTSPREKNPLERQRKKTVVKVANVLEGGHADAAVETSQTGMSPTTVTDADLKRLKSVSPKKKRVEKAKLEAERTIEEKETLSVNGVTTHSVADNGDNEKIEAPVVVTNKKVKKVIKSEVARSTKSVVVDGCETSTMDAIPPVLKPSLLKASLDSELVISREESRQKSPTRKKTAAAKNGNGKLKNTDEETVVIPEAVGKKAKSVRPSTKQQQQQQQKDGEEKSEMIANQWVECFSVKQNRKFWKNSATGKSTWSDPFSSTSKAKTSDTEADTLNEVKSSTQSGSTVTLNTQHEVWQEMYSEAKQRKYWKNKSTGKATWIEPKVVTGDAITSAAVNCD